MAGFRGLASLDPADNSHAGWVGALKEIKERLATTTPVLTEAFHLLTPGSIGADNLIQFISEGGLTVWLRKVFTVDRGDFTTYRIKQGHRHHAFELIKPANCTEPNRLSEV